jgi:hypothetical protein
MDMQFVSDIYSPSPSIEARNARKNIFGGYRQNMGFARYLFA